LHLNINDSAVFQIYSSTKYIMVISEHSCEQLERNETMELFEALLIGLSVSILGFVGFSLKKQYRYATQIFDMLRYYPILVGISLIFSLLAIYSWLDITTCLLLSPFVGIFCLILLNQSLNWLSDYSTERFRNFLKDLKSEEFVVISFDEYEAGLIDSGKVNVVLRHDVDISLDRTLKMAEIQKELGIQATYFFRLHAEKYTFEEAKPIIKGLANDGFGIGLHYETLSIAEGDLKKAIEFLKNDIQRLREIAPVSVVAAHGQKLYKNREIWGEVDKLTLQITSAYDMKYNIYLSDAGGKRLSGKDGKYLFDRIYEAKPGQIIQVLIHPDWWN